MNAQPASNRRLIIASLVVSAGVVVAVVAALRPANEQTASSSPVAAPAVTRSAGAAPARPASVSANGSVALDGARTWTPGLTLTYDYDAVMAVRLDGTDPDLDTPDALVQGRWSLTVADVTDDAVRVHARLDRARVAPEALVPDPAVLATPFELRMDLDGRLRGAAFPPTMPATARQTLRSIAAATQMVLRDGARWTSPETHLSGESRATYRRDAGDRDRVERRRTFIAANTAFSDEAVLELDEARTTFELHPSGHPARVEAVEATRLDQEGVKVRTRQRATLALLEAKVGPVPTALVGLQDEAIDAVAGEDDRAHDLQALDGLTMGALRDALAGLDLEVSADRDRAARLLGQAEAMLRVDPASADAMVEAIREGVGVAVLTSALGNSGTAAGRRALRGLLGDEDASLRAEAARSMVLMPEVDGASIDALAVAVADEDDAVADSAALALGSTARKGSGLATDADPFEILHALWAAAPRGPEKARALSALGNLGGARVLPAMLDGLGSGHPQEATAAVWGLRFVPGAKADALLMAMLERGDETLRDTAVAAVRLRDPAVWAPRLAAMGL